MRDPLHFFGYLIHHDANHIYPYEFRQLRVQDDVILGSLNEFVEFAWGDGFLWRAETQVGSCFDLDKHERIVVNRYDI